MDNSNNSWVIDNSKDAPPMFIPKEELNGAKHGDSVIAQQSLIIWVINY